MKYPHDGYAFGYQERYKVLRILGSGSFGIVYKVENKAGRFYACKVLSHQVLLNPEKLDKFQRETRIGINLSHEHLVSFHKNLLIRGDVSHDDELIYPAIVMDYVDGFNLDTFRKKYQKKHHKRLPRNVATLLLAKSCSGLEVLHQQNIRHGDIKPENILISKSGYPKVTDYGISALIGQETNDRSITGTLRYLAPEQFQKASDPQIKVDLRADIYALGMVALELTVGLPKTLYGKPFSVMHYVVNRNGDLLDYVQKADLSKDLKFVIRACLDRDTEKRPLKIRDLQNVLLHTLYGKGKGITLEDIGDSMKRLT